ncbi:MAG: ComEA family DNA-binding protein [bacterium]
MKILQAGIISFLTVSLAASLPGLYYATEISNPPSKSSANKPNVSSNLQLPNYQSLSKPQPDPDDLPETHFSLRPLSDSESRKIERILRVDINKANKSRLQKINGIGPKTAGAIIRYRRGQGRIRSVAELKNIRGIGPVTAQNIAQQITLEGRIPGSSPGSTTEPTHSINLNTAGHSELTNIPGIGSVTARRILDYRKTHGPFDSFQDVKNVKGIGPATLENIRNNSML